MYFTKTEFDDAASSMKKEITAVTSELNKIGKACLFCRKRKGHIFFTEYNGMKEHGISRDKGRIRQLARKCYLEEYLKVLTNNLKAVEYCKKHYIYFTPEIIVENLIAKHPNLPRNILLMPNADDWASEPYMKNPHYMENLEYITAGGTIVRSKSEWIIASMLETMGIPYRYDVQIKCGKQIYYADFVIKRSDGTLLIWEHFGRTYDKVYMAKNKVRIEDYIQLGYRPWDNLIWTYESDIKDTRNIKKIIKRFYY